ncbi:hypothetical protein [Janthinobacterium sp. B9-8]|uniref:hypothetical protein n=1 Tax=Janthinobacterium sp. B9-8 TaxID=1236179 RepID=UPI00061D19D4|nr:hypothetical protein [Janthinobacterium sp. B9-8]AMC36621.1 hypothetical protein VN23_19505 [Janthinobacterium sp. B9-8]
MSDTLKLDPCHTQRYIGLAAFNHADEIGVSNEIADKPLPSGFFTSVHTTVAPSMVGRGGGYLGSVGLLFRRYANSATFLPPSIGVERWELNSLEIGASTMPKLCRVLLSHVSFSIVVLTIYSQASLAVIALALITLGLIQVIGGTQNDN